MNLISIFQDQCEYINTFRITRTAFTYLIIVDDEINISPKSKNSRGQINFVIRPYENIILHE